MSLLKAVVRSLRKKSDPIVKRTFSQSTSRGESGQPGQKVRSSPSKERERRVCAKRKKNMNLLIKLRRF